MSTNTYQVGGCLPPDAPTYVERLADKELYDSVIAGNYCYVLNSRQMGKSSLRVQTMKKLQTAGVACAAIDITLVGTQQVTPEQWYGGLIQSLLNSFELEEKFDLINWWNHHGNLSPVQCLGIFIEGELLREISQPVVIFIDEIDSILQLDFKEDFLAFIRACHDRRADNPDYKRLTFVLLGVTTPSDLIRDKRYTPFNVGKAIELDGFKLDEVIPLVKGLKGKVANCEEVIKEILAWTKGQPFITQKICQLICNYKYFIRSGEEKHLIEKLVRTHIIENWETQDEPEHLRTIRDRILINNKSSGRLLQVYKQILQQEKIYADSSLEQIELRLSGIVIKIRGELRIYNRIYASVFNQNWIHHVSGEMKSQSSFAPLQALPLVSASVSEKKWANNVSGELKSQSSFAPLQTPLLVSSTEEDTNNSIPIIKNNIFNLKYKPQSVNNGNIKIPKLRKNFTKSKLLKYILILCSCAIILTLIGMTAISWKLLNEAEKLAKSGSFPEAITIALKINSSFIFKNETKKLINQCSEGLLKQATDKYENEGELENAIKLINLIPVSSSSYQKTQNIITNWRDEYKANNNALYIAKTAVSQKQWQEASQALQEVKNTTNYWNSQIELVESNIPKNEREYIGAEPIRALW